MELPNNNPFADVGSYELVFAKEEETPEQKQEQPKEEGKEPIKTADEEVEIEDVLDPIKFGDEDTAKNKQVTKAEQETKQALEEGEDDLDYTAIAKQNVKLGIWEDYEGSDDPNFELDKETFKQLADLQEKTKKEAIKNSVFESLDADEKEFLEFKKNGGNLDLYYQARQRQQAVNNNLDISTDQGKQNAIFTYYKHLVGWSDEKIYKHIEAKIKSLEIDEEAEFTYEKVKEKVDNDKKELVQKQQQAAEARKQQIKEYQGSLRNELKAANYDTNKIKSVVDAFTSFDESNLSPIDKTYVSFKGDAKKAVMLYEFMSDPDAFIQKYAKKEAKETEKKIFLQLKNATKPQDNTTTKEITLKNKSTSPFF